MGWLGRCFVLVKSLGSGYSTVITELGAHVTIAYELLMMYLDNKENIDAQHYWGGGY